LEEILGTDQFAQNFALWSAYVTSEVAINSCWQTRAGFGYAERPPDLTEFYAAEPFMFLLQNGLNTVTGDPRLDAERRLQFDLGFDCDQGSFRCGAEGFYAWVFDYVTFENMRTFLPPTNIAEQVNLKFVNTEMATLAGCELYAEYDLTEWVTPFATMQYIEGRDHTRNGDFATRPATGGAASVRAPGLPRGWFSGVPGGKQEPLPGMPPLESRLGFRLQPANGCSHWSMEISAHVVDNQDRVAVSLLETPTPGFTVWDIRGYWQPSDALLIVAGVENFTNKNYREHFDYRARNGIQMFQPGVNFYFGTELIY
jgi:outer membrane receptor protein involved in Fe transport